MFMGAPASGKTVTFRSVDIIRIRDGKAVEHWGVNDNLALMTQLGLVHMGH
jgi:predicted ester cyclase